MPALVDHLLVRRRRLRRVAERHERRGLLIARVNARVGRRIGIGGGLELGERGLGALALGRKRQAAGGGAGCSGRADARGLHRDRFGEQRVRPTLHAFAPDEIANRDDGHDGHDSDDGGRFPLARLERLARLPRDVLELVFLEMMPFRSFHV